MNVLILCSLLVAAFGASATLAGTLYLFATRKRRP
jgi:hypothetical protein